MPCNRHASPEYILLLHYYRIYHGGAPCLICNKTTKVLRWLALDSRHMCTDCYQTLVDDKYADWKYCNKCTIAEEDSGAPSNSVYVFYKKKKVFLKKANA